MNIRNSFKHRIIALVFLTSTALVFSRCKKDNLGETLVDAPTSSAVMDGFQSGAVSADGITSGSYYLENSLPSGYVKDGSKDYTSYVQAAVSKYSNIVFPAFPIQVNDNGIVIGSNKTITFLEGSEIRLKPTSNGTYSILKIASVSNVTLYNPVVTGDRFSHTGTGGEAGIGINIRGANDITIYSPKVTNCWGDGIYIGQADNRINSKNIIIKDSYLKKNRRDGISIIGVDGLLLDGIYAGYSDGTLPMSGINFEPNNTTSEIKNVRINNARTEYNGANGIQIGLSNMLGTTNKTSDITVVNHVDIGSPRYAFKMRCNNVNGATAKMYGKIEIINPSWNKTETDQPLYLGSNQSDYKTSVYSPLVTTRAGTTLSYSSAYTLLMKQARSGSLSVSNVLPTGSTYTETATETIAPAPVQTTSGVVFAVNAGGSSFTASNGITYSADKNYSSGRVEVSSNSISNTADDKLYQSERFGTFSYAIPLSDGTYEITFKLAEIYFKASGKRQFDILAENNEIVSNLDIFRIAGSNVAYDVVKTVTVTDGTLNLNFRTDVNNAKVNAFHIIKK